MEIKIVKFGLRIYATLNIRRIRTVRGVNSQIDAETHFLMWDFDGIPFHVVRESLKSVQDMFDLPDISIVSTGIKEGKPGYHAYCWRACTLLEARTIIAATPNVDRHFVAAGIGRGYFTLRFSEIPTRQFSNAGMLPGKVAADLDYKDISCFVEYSKAV